MHDKVRSEQSITDDEKTRFLIELMLTKSWTNEFESYVKMPSEVVGYFTHVRFCDYMHHIGLLRYAGRHEEVFEISVRGRKFLDKQRRKT